MDPLRRYTITRRHFLGSTALVVLPVLCGGGCATNGPEVTIVDLPPVVNQSIVIPFDEFPELKSAGGSIVGKTTGYANPIVIARVRDEMFAALDAICTHMRCTVAYNALNITLDCPCHGSTYEVDGTVIGGPAPRALRTFATRADATAVTITLA
jgi:Rieske Fe-S protein